MACIDWLLCIRKAIQRCVCVSIHAYFGFVVCSLTCSPEHGITGDVLVNLDHETLKDLSMHSVGQRMEILKHIYTLKALWRIPLNEWDYVPPSMYI